MKLQDVAVRNEDVSAIQFYSQILKENGDVKVPDSFDIILKSGNVLHVQAGKDVFDKAVEALGID